MFRAGGGILGLMVLGLAVCLMPSAVTRASSRVADESLIYFWDRDGVATISPDGQNRTRLPRKLIRANAGRSVAPDPYTARVSPDGTTVAWTEAESLKDESPGKVLTADVGSNQFSEELAAGNSLILGGWSADGKKLVYGSRHAKHTNWVVDVAAKQATELNLPLFSFGDDKRQPLIRDWSADGQWFLAVADGLYLIKADGSVSKLIAGQEYAVRGRCRIALDGRKAFFNGEKKGGGEVLYVVDLVGGKPQAILEAANFGSIMACWSPDSRRIAYSCRTLDANGRPGEESTLNVMDADGSNVKALITERHRLATTLVAWDWR